MSDSFSKLIRRQLGRSQVTIRGNDPNWQQKVQQALKAARRGEATSLAPQTEPEVNVFLYRLINEARGGLR